MKKSSGNSATFLCSSCGAVHKKWQGQCGDCGAWNSIREEKPLGAGPKSLGMRGNFVELGNLNSKESPPPRTCSGIDEFDRVLGGGLVPASAILLGGDPGIGKSTLLLQVTARFSNAGLKTIYISGEEATGQIRMRAVRLGLSDTPVLLGSETNLRNIITTLEREKPQLVIIDSIQTMWIDTIESSPGSVSQLRSCAHELVTFAKRYGVSVVLVGHVTKEGHIAGPRVIEHMVDTVLYFEGERGHQFRILRAVKNRFGPADEIGVFEMTGSGLAEVANPSALFLSERDAPSSGSVVFAGIEGTRPVLTEIQALIAPSTLASPRRTVVGLDSGRVSTILAVLEARCAILFSGLDIFLNVAGGLRVFEPAADLAIAGALLSAREDIAIAPDMVLFGEISLSGALRAVSQTESRLKEASKLGFQQAVLAKSPKLEKFDTMNIHEQSNLVAFAQEIFGTNQTKGS